MRQITQESINAFENLKPFKKSNTEVKILGTTKGVPTWAELYLFDNRIAELHKTPIRRVLRITNAGWKSNTTKERLNGLDGVKIKQSKGVWYLNGEAWDGEMIEV